MAEPLITQKAPFPVQVEAGRSYWWCACGRSQTQPFCDGSHKGTTFTPREFRVDASELIYFCGCKHSAKMPLCDGTHKRL